MVQNSLPLQQIELDTLVKDLREGSITHYLDKSFNQYTLVDVFTQQAKHSGDSCALIAHDGELSYETLLHQAQGWAHYLNSIGVKKGDRVGICLERNIQLMPALLGILMCGASYIPADPYFPADRIQLILEDAKALVVIAQRSTMHIIEGCSFIKNLLLADDTSLQNTINAPHGSAVDTSTQYPCADDVAYIMFTSGSTGRPKGVPITHGAMSNFLLSMAIVPGANSSDRVLALTTLSFDISVLELFLPLLVGGTIVLANREDILDPFRLAHLIDQHKASTLQATPATWRMLIESGWKPQKNQKILCGGEAFPNDLAAVLYENSAQLWNMYGPTEATVWASCHRISEDDIAYLTTSSGSIPLGNTLANVNYLIVNKAGGLSQPEEPGELWIGGECLSAGYIERPELNAKQFIMSDLLGGNSNRYYRTGDLVQQNNNRHIYYIDRIDNQVKVRGFRIELGEIETILKQSEQVQDAVVIVHKPKSGDGHLIACIRAEASDVSFEDLSTLLAKHVPQYMVPSQWTTLEAFPLTPNNKVDRKQLANIVLANMPKSNINTLEPSDDVSKKLISLWNNLLSVDICTIDDDFFKLGGHSLLAARLALQIQNEFNIQTNIVDIFNYPTLNKQLGFINNSEANTFTELVSDSKGPFNLTTVQKGIWFIGESRKNHNIYHESEAYLVDGVLNKILLEEAVKQLINENDVFSLSIQDNGNVTWHPMNRAEIDTPFRIVSVADTFKNTSLSITLHNEAKHPFQLSKAPLIRVTLFEFIDQKHVIQITAHHLLVDGISQTLVWKRLFEIYEQLQAGTVATHQNHTLGFSHYLSQYTHESKLKKQSERELAYWKNIFEDKGISLELPTDKPRPQDMDFSSTMSTATLEQDIYNKVQLIAHQYTATPFMVLLSCYFIFLAKRSGQSDISVGTPVSGRNRLEWEPVIGNFINTVALRSQLPKQLSLHNVIDEVKTLTLGAFSNQTIPFEQVVEAINPARDPSRTPLYQTLITFNDYTGRPTQLKDETAISPLSVNTGYAYTDIVFFVALTTGQIQLKLSASKQLFLNSTVQTMLYEFIEVLSTSLETPEHIQCQIDETVNKKKHSKQAINTTIINPNESVLEPKEISQMESTLLAIWTSVLEIDHINVNDNFFNIGGHSLKALSVFSKIHKELKINAPLSTLLHAPTIRELALKLEEYNTSWQSLVPFREEGDASPVFCIHALGGNVLNYRHLKDYIDESHPLWGVQARGLDGITAIPTSLNEMAKNYAQEIFECCNGLQPILLGGSMGGAIAIAVAKELQNKNITPKLVIMIDTIGPNAVDAAFDGQYKFEGIFHLLTIIKYSLKARSEHYIKLMLVKFYISRSKALPVWLRPFNIESNHRQAYRNYTPEPYHGKVVLIRQPLNKIGMYSDPLLGWGKVLKGLHIEYVEGDHAEMIEDKEVGSLVNQLIGQL